MASETIRLFLAIFPPPEIVQYLTDTTRPLAAALSPNALSWIPPAQIHLTLNFLGHTQPESVIPLEKTLENVCQAASPHPLRARGLGCFPTPARPRIIWAGLSAPSPALSSLKQKLDHALTNLGYLPENRPFHPHLTLARVKHINAGDRRPLAQAMRDLREADFGHWTAARLDLMQSTLSPAGASYSLVKSFPLARKSPIPQ